MSDASKNQFLKNINRDFEERSIENRARDLGIGYVNMVKFVPNIDVLDVVSEKDARVAEVFPLELTGKNLKLALVNPEKEETKSLIEQIQKKFKIDKYLCSRHGWQEKMPLYNSELVQKKKIGNEVLSAGKERKINFKEEIKDYTQWKEKINTQPSQNALNEIKIMALRLNTSDIHIQPFADHALLRFRIDGILYDIFEIPLEQAQKIVLRIKYEGGMKSNITNVPQDGHIDFEYEERKINFRISTIPTPFLESIVMRVLDSQKGFMTLERLGFTLREREKIENQYKKSQGMVLVTGPTGSGKTTSLYAILSNLNTSEKKIVTLEDPIEYRFEGISQSQINPKEGYTFETGFESVLRHDPDVILVGEVRNLKTARLACEASMTGHLVLSSLHTNSAVESVARLRNLGIENFNIAPAINLILAQRLVRKIVPERAKEIPIPQEPRIKKALKRIQQLFPTMEIPETILQAIEDESYGSPYDGRLAVGEVLEVDKNVQNMIVEQKSTLEIETFLKEKTDFLTLFEGGIIKVLKHQTTLEEVYRVLG